MMPSAAAPHSTASIWSRVGVATRRLGGGGGGAGRSSSALGSVAAVATGCLDAERALDGRDHVRERTPVVHDHRRLAQAPAADLLGRAGGGRPLQAVGLVGGIEEE